MDTGKRIVARIPTPVAGPPRLTTNSEVATITYLQSKISLPVPEILSWSDDPSNPVGSEYIIQDHVNGVQLHEHWSQMDTPQHMLSTKALALKLREMASLDFPAYGNIYFASAPIENASSKIPLEDGFCTGPYCNPLFWNCGAGELELYGQPNSNCGPSNIQLNSSLSRLFHYCFTSWRDGAPAIRQELIDIAILWPQLQLPGLEPPYSPSKQELADHARQFEDFETMQKLKTWLRISMQTTSDGWLPNEVWDAALEANRAAYHEWIETARESEEKGGDMTIERADKLWPFDAR